MSKRSCQNCLYVDQCSAERPCSHYFPVDEDGEDPEVLIEKGRKLFYEEWRAYMKESQDSDF